MATGNGGQVLNDKGFGKFAKKSHFLKTSSVLGSYLALTSLLKRSFLEDDVDPHGEKTQHEKSRLKKLDVSSLNPSKKTRISNHTLA